MTKLCSRGKSAAKRKFSVYPSAYANAYASKGAYNGKFIEVEMNDKRYSNSSLKNYYNDLLK